MPSSESDAAEVSDRKNQQDASTVAHSSDLFSVHNFDVTIDLNFPAGWCYRPMHIYSRCLTFYARHFKSCGHW